MQRSLMTKIKITDPHHPQITQLVSVGMDSISRHFPHLRESLCPLAALPISILPAAPGTTAVLSVDLPILGSWHEGLSAWLPSLCRVFPVHLQ